MSTPATLPANFFDDHDSAPQTLPTDHFDKAAAPKSLPADFDFARGETSSKIADSLQTRGLDIPSNATISPSTPTTWERIKSVVTEGIPGLSSQTVYSGKYQDPGKSYGSAQVISPEAAMTPLQQEKHPVLTGAGEVVGSLTTPGNVALIAGSAVAGTFEAALPRLISAGFSASMVKNAYDTVPAIRQAADRGDVSEVERLLTHLVGNAALAYAGGRFAAKGPAAPVEGSTSPSLNSPSTAEPSTVQIDPAKVTLGPTPQDVRIDNAFREAAEVIAPQDPEMTLDRLTKSVEGKQLSAKPTLSQQTSAAVSRQLNSISTSASSAWDAVSDAASKLWDSYRRPPEWTDFKDAVGRFGGQLQAGDLELQRFGDAIKDAIPDKARRVALTNYVQAGGNRELLEARANASTDPALAAGYRTALELNPEETKLADNIRAHMEAKFKEAQDAGMLSHAVENYLPQIWDKSDNPVAQKLRAAAAINELQPNPSFIRQRVFDSYADGEAHGFIPKDKDAGFLVAQYNQAFNRAIAARTFIKGLHEGTASDGRPLVSVSGSGARVEAPDGESASYFIKPRVKPEDTADYRFIDHPALRGWKWATSDADGNPIFVQGDILVHPEVADQLKNILGTSAIRQYASGRAALAASAEVKSTLLSASPFHMVQLGVHSLEHMVSPFRLPELDLNDLTQRQLVDHGLIVSDYRAMQDFSEGVAGSSGLLNRVPGIGKILQGYNEWTFREYLPKLKMKLAQSMLDRNLERYSGDLTRDQILRLSAEQANAALGGLDYKGMARNKTLQDSLRLLSLSPDFTEARTRFVGQALKPYGMEQRAALLRGAAMMIGAKYLAGQLVGQKQDYSPAHLFRIQMPDGREYGLRTIQGDLGDLIGDSRKFFQYRLNPGFARPVMEAITGRDAFGRERTAGQQIQDYYRTAIPIPLKGFIPGTPQTPADTLLQSIGVQSKRYQANEQNARRRKISSQIVELRNR